MRVMVLHNICNHGYSFGRIYHELGYDVTIGFLDDDDRKDVVDVKPEIKQLIIGADSTIRLITRIRRFASNIDLFHCNFCLSPVMAGYWYKLVNGRKYVAHARGNDIRDNIRDKWYGFMIEHAIRKANLFLVSTPDLLTIGRTIRNDVYWLPNPVDTETFQPTRPEIDLHQGFDYVGFMPARIHFKTKGTDAVVKQFSKLPSDFSLHLVNHGISPDYYRLLELTEKLGLRSRVFIHERIPRKDMVQFYNASDVIIDQFGGLQGFGNVTLEGLACEKVVITDYNGFDYPEKPPIKPTQVENLAEVLLKLRSERRYNPAGRGWVLKYHSSQRVKKLLREELKRAGLQKDESYFQN